MATPRTRSAVLALSTVTCIIALSSCAPTTIVGELTTTTAPADTPSTTLATPTGTVAELLQQLADVSVGLGDAIVERDTATADQRLARATAIGAVLEERFRAAGVDLVEDVQRIVGLVRTAVERKRPADADKAQRFAMLVRDAAADLL